MAGSTFVQFRTTEEDKRQAAEILDSLGTNLSTVFNMLLKQIILTRGIPFEIKLPQSVTKEDIQRGQLENVAATMRIEGMPLDEWEEEVLRQYQKGSLTAEQVKEMFLRDTESDHV